MASPKAAAPVHITNQFRRRSAMVYDFKCEGERLTLSLSPRQTPEDPGDWHMVASQSSTSDAIDGWGPSPKEALGAVSRSWTGRYLPVFDWSAIEAALVAVRAI